MRKALALTVAAVVVATGMRFAWDRLLGTGLGGAIDGARRAAGEVFSSEDVLRSGEMITGALIREEYLPADGRGYRHRVSYTDRDSLARWTQSATFDALVRTRVDTREIREDAVQPRWDDPSSIVYVVRLPEPQLERPFWVSQPRDIDVHCNLAEAMWRFATVNPSACVDDAVHADPLLRWKAEQDFEDMASDDAELRETGKRDVEEMVEGIATPFITPLANENGFEFGFEFVWYPVGS